MTAIWLVMFIVSSVLLLLVILRSKLSWGWLRIFALHLILAAVCLYLLNYSGLISGLYVPLNPITIGTVVVLGVPGVGLLAGLQLFVV